MASSSSFAVFIGIDWGDRRHALCVSDANGQSECGPLDHKAEAIEAWVAGLRSRFPGQRIAVCLEQSRGALLYALMKYDCLVLFPINPKQLARYRDAMYPSGSKDDPVDAVLLCQLLREHHSRLRAWAPDDPTTRELRLLTEARRQWVKYRTALGNQLLQKLKECYPLAAEMVVGHIHTGRVLKLLEKFPSQRELQRASPQQLQRHFPKPRRVADDPSRAETLAQRVADIRAAQPLVTDAAVLDSGRLAVQHLVPVLQQLNSTIAAYDARIAQLLAQHPDAELFRALPGAGAALAPRLVAAFGSDRSRYNSAEELQRLSGIAPIQRRSGKSCVVLSRFACPKFLKQTFHEFARCSRLKSAWARAYLAMLRARGVRTQAAVRSLAFKWIRILYRCWKNRQPYDERHYLERLRLNKSPLLAYLDCNISTAIP